MVRMILTGLALFTITFLSAQNNKFSFGVEVGLHSNGGFGGAPTSDYYLQYDPAEDLRMHGGVTALYSVSNNVELKTGLRTRTYFYSVYYGDFLLGDQLVNLHASVTGGQMVSIPLHLVVSLEDAVHVFGGVSYDWVPDFNQGRLEPRPLHWSDEEYEMFNAIQSAPRHSMLSAAGGFGFQFGHFNLDLEFITNLTPLEYPLRYMGKNYQLNFREFTGFLTLGYVFDSPFGR